MAQHDYNIANQSGAAFRADLNNALLAIVSQNSGTSAPSTTFAHQFWADTTTGTLKIRNAANSAWIELMQLDGTLTMEDGTALLPGLAFRDDLNTGLFSDTADTLGISTGGVERVEFGTTEVVFNDGGADVDFRIEGDTNANLFFVDAGNDRIGVGTGSPASELDVVGNIRAVTSTTSATTVRIGNTGNNVFLGVESSTGGSNITGATAYAGTITSNGPLQFSTVNGASVQATLDGSGRLGIGTTSPSNALHISTSNGTPIKIESTSANSYINFVNSNNGQGYIGYESQAMTFYTANAERARIDSSGRLLVGTSSNIFSQKFQVATTDGQALEISRFNTNGGAAELQFVSSRNATIGSHTIKQNGDGLGRIAFRGSDGSNYLAGAMVSAEVDGTPGASDMPGRLVFSTTADGASSPTERMRIRQNGYISIGDPANYGFEISPYASNGGHTFEWNRASTASVTTAATFRNAGTTVGSISYGNTSTAFNTSSDYRLKENIVPLTGAAGRVNQLQVHRFNFIADPDTTVDGFIAHEAQAVVPEAVTGTHNEVDDDGNPVYQGIDQSKLVPLLTAALQEALAKIETLEQRLNDAGIA